jgi:NADH:ubiquinone oxidoreductase subunit 2 (subunit N)
VTLIAFLGVCVAGTVLGLVTLPYARLSRVVAIASLAAALAAAMLMNPDDSVTIGEVELATGWFVGFFLSTLTAASLLLCLVGLVTGWPERLAPAALTTFAAIGVAISATDPAVVLLAAAAATVPAALVANRMRSTPLSVTVGLAELRTLALVISAAVLAVLTVPNGTTAQYTSWAGSDPTIVGVLAFFALAVALAARSGAVPFHVPAALLSRSGEGLGLALALVWIPTGLGLVAVSWSVTTIDAPGEWIDRAVVAIQIVAVATLILGAVGAMLHDELEEIVTYSLIQDAGFVLLAMTARSADAAPSARLWLVVFVLAKTGLVAWAAAASWAFGSSNLGELRGWLRRSPILGLALAAVVVATLGWPGSGVFEARATLVDLGLPAWMSFMSLAAILLSLAYYGRVFAVGLLSPAPLVAIAGGDRPKWPHYARVEEPPIDEEAASEAGSSAASEYPDEPEAAPIPELAAATALDTMPGPPVATEAATLDELIEATAASSPEPEVEIPPKSQRATTAQPRKPSRDRRGHVSARHRIAAAWRLNRPLEASLLVLAIAGLAVAVAFGGFQSAGATANGISLDQAIVPLSNGGAGDNGGSPAPTDTPEPTAEITPEPATPTPSPSASATPSQTPASPAPGSGSPSVSPSPSASVGG